MKPEILIDETLEEVTFKIKRITPPEYDNQLELLEATGLLDNLEGFQTDVITSSNLTLDDILNAACSYFNVSKNIVQSKSRKRELVTTRKCYALAAREIFKKDSKITLTKIGKKVGRDHSDILHYYRVYDSDLEFDRKYGHQNAIDRTQGVEAIKKHLNGHLIKHNQKVEAQHNGR